VVDFPGIVTSWTFVPALMSTRRVISFKLSLNVRLVLAYMPKWQTIAVDQAEREMYIEPWFMASKRQNTTLGYIVGEFFCTSDRHTLEYVRQRVTELICKPLGRVDVCASKALRMRDGTLLAATLRQAGVRSKEELRDAIIGWVYIIICLLSKSYFFLISCTRATCRTMTKLLVTIDSIDGRVPASSCDA
jgi:hypothetical protein